MLPGVINPRLSHRIPLQLIEMTAMAIDSRQTMNKTESTHYSEAALEELMELASDLRAHSPDSALAALTEAKVARSSMARDC